MNLTESVDVKIKNKGQPCQPTGEDVVVVEMPSILSFETNGPTTLLELADWPRYARQEFEKQSGDHQDFGESFKDFAVRCPEKAQQMIRGMLR